VENQSTEIAEPISVARARDLGATRRLPRECVRQFHPSLPRNQITVMYLPAVIDDLRQRLDQPFRQ
jgi:hypothetical protein